MVAYGVKRIKLVFANKGKYRNKVWGISLLPQAVLISSIKPISISLILVSEQFEARFCEHFSWNNLTRPSSNG